MFSFFPLSSPRPHDRWVSQEIDPTCAAAIFSRCGRSQLFVSMARSSREESAVSLSRYSPLAFCIVLLAAVAPGGAAAQEDRWNKIDLKPLIAPILPLPPNAQVTPGAFDPTPTPGNSTPSFNNSQAPTAPAGGLRITIPTR